MADFNYVTALGLIVPDTSEIDEQVRSEWREALGQDLITEPETPAGAMIAAIVEGRDAVARNNAEVANQINPDIAGGVWLDALGALTFFDRLPATRSVLTGVILTGVSGTIIPAGSIALVSGTQAQFSLAGTVQLGSNGTAAGTFIAVDTGPVEAPAGQLENIATSVLGWETVSNPASAVLGSNRQSDAEYRRQRRLTLGAQTSGSLVSILGKVRRVPDVVSAIGRENVENSTQVIDGLSLVAHSVYIIVDGGLDQSIAAAILAGKDGGADYNGEVEVAVLEPISGQTYLVRFGRPELVTVQVRVTARFNNLDGQSIIEDALQRYQDGQLENETGLTIGVPVSPFEISGAINQVEPRIFVTKVELSTDGLTWAQSEIPIALDQKAGFANIVVVPA